MSQRRPRPFSETTNPVPGQCTSPRHLVQLARAVHSVYSTIDCPACASLARRASRLALCVENPPRQSASAFLWLDDVHCALTLALRVAPRVRKYGDRRSPLSPIRAFIAARVGGDPARDLQTVRTAAGVLEEWLSAFTAIHTPPNIENDSLGAAGDESRHGTFSVIGESSEVASVPPLPSRYVTLNATQTDQVKTCLLRIAAGESATNVVCISGVWGVGKTTFSTAVALDSTVADAFPDGVAWLRLGPFLSDAAFLHAIASALSIFSRPVAAEEVERLVAPTPSALASIGREHQLDCARCLLVLDDVEGPVGASRLGSVLSMFGAGNRTSPKRSAAIFTTSQRAKELVAWDTVEFTLRAMAPLCADALLLFDAWAKLGPLHPNYDSAARSRLVLSCGGFPIALALTGAAVRKSKFAWARAAAMLDTSQAGGLLVGCDGESTVSLVLRWVTSLCGDQFANWMGAMSAFPRGALVPETVLAGLWRTDCRNTRRIMQSVGRLGFGIVEPIGRDGNISLQLHDVVHVYCARLADSPTDYHRTLVDECGKAAGIVANLKGHSQNGDTRPWWRIASGDDYVGRFLGWHMVRAELAPELVNLLLDYRWIVCRLGKVCALRDDYKTLLSSRQDIVDRGNIITLSSAVVNACAYSDSDAMLAFELHMCLSEAADDGDQAARCVLTSAEQYAQRPWFRPLPASWRKRTRTSHDGFVAKLAACTTGPVPAAASVGEEGAVRVWSLKPGEEGSLLWDLGRGRKKAQDGFSVAQMSEDFVLCGSVQGFINVWSLQLGRNVRSRRSHKGAVTAIASSVSLVPGRPFYIISGSTDGSVVAFDLFRRSWEKVYPSCSMDEVTALYVLTEQRQFLVGSYDGFASLWSIESGERCLSLNGHKDHVTQFCALQDRRRLFASSCSSGYAYVWSADDGSLLWTRQVGYDLTNISLRLYCERNFARSALDLEYEQESIRYPYFCARSQESGGELVAVSSVGEHELMARASMKSSITAIEEVPGSSSGGDGAMIVLVGLDTGFVVPLHVVTSLATRSKVRLLRRNTMRM